jgi:hypothetical protein
MIYPPRPKDDSDDDNESFVEPSLWSYRRWVVITELNSSWSLSATRFWLMFPLHAVLEPVPQENSSSLIILISAITIHDIMNAELQFDLSL